MKVRSPYVEGSISLRGGFELPTWDLSLLFRHQFHHRHEPKAVGGFRCADDQVIEQFQTYEIRAVIEAPMASI